MGGRSRPGRREGRGGDLDYPPDKGKPSLGSKAEQNSGRPSTAEAMGVGTTSAHPQGKLTTQRVESPPWALAIRALMEPGLHASNYMNGDSLYLLTDVMTCRLAWGRGRRGLSAESRQGAVFTVTNMPLIGQAEPDEKKKQFEVRGGVAARVGEGEKGEGKPRTVPGRMENRLQVRRLSATLEHHRPLRERDRCIPA